MTAWRRAPTPVRVWLLALGAALGCDAPSTPPPAATTTPTAPPPERERVVSLSPLATRFVRALGAEATLVAADAESARLPGLEGLPLANLASAADHAPDLVLLPPDAAEPLARERLAETGASLVVFAPHELEEVFELTRTLGARLAGASQAQRFEARLGRPLAAVGGESFGRRRPRVVAVVELDPVVIAGGHSFETDLIEIAGGRSVTHASEEPRQRVGPGGWEALAPDLILVLSAAPLGPAKRSGALDALPVAIPIEFLSVDAGAFWLDEDPTETARRLRRVIEPLSRAMQEDELSSGAGAPSEG